MDNVLKYNDFIATVKYSDEDEAFIGQIEGINSIVSFEGQTIQELKSAFKEAVESYLDFCERIRTVVRGYNVSAERTIFQMLRQRNGI
jgi:predicted HicB family RNase H-like nuclease